MPSANTTPTGVASPRGALGGPRLAMGLSAAMFGVAVVPAQRAVDDLTPGGAVLIRFWVAALAVALFSAVSARRAPAPHPGAPTDELLADPEAQRRLLWQAGLVAGAINVVGFCVISLALERTTASNTAFLASMSVVIIPVASVLRGSRRLTGYISAGVVCAVLGSFLLSGASLSIGAGDGLAIFDAFIASAHITAVGYYAPKLSARAFNLTQLAVSAVLAVPIVAVVGFGEFTSGALAAAALCGLLQAAALGLQVSGQQGVDPTSAAVLLLIAPVVGALAAMAVRGDRFNGTGALGALLILAAVVIAEVLPARRSQQAASAVHPQGAS